MASERTVDCSVCGEGISPDEVNRERPWVLGLNVCHVCEKKIRTQSERFDSLEQIARELVVKAFKDAVA